MKPKKTWKKIALTRPHVVVMIAFLLLVVIGFRLLDMSVGTEVGLKSFTQEKVFSPEPRRMIVDRNDFILAANTQVYDLNINPRLVRESDIQQIATQLQWDKKKTQEKIKQWQDYQQKNRQYAVFERGLLLPEIERLNQAYENWRLSAIASEKMDDAQARVAALQQLGCTSPATETSYNVISAKGKEITAYLRCRGIELSNVSRRIYPMSFIAAPMIGITTREGLGQTGLERQYDQFLQTGRVKEQQERDVRGKLIALSVNKNQPLLSPAPLEKSFRSTIDVRLQAIAYQHLRDVIEPLKAHSGMVIIVSAKNGEILANVNYPSFNPNQRDNLDVGLLKSTVFVDPFEPGSTVKPLVLAKLLEHSSLNTEDMVDVNYGLWQAGNDKTTIIRDESHLHRRLSVREIIIRSSNVGISHLVDRYFRPEKLRQYYQEMGFGVRTEVNYPSESEGQMAHSLRRIDMLRNSFGYGFSVTAAQLVSAYQAIANNGERITLSLRKIDESQKVHNAIFSPQSSREVLDILESVVNSSYGTARLARIPGYRIGGKTGTARRWQEAEKGKDGKWKPGYYDEAHHRVLFVGVAPADDPDMVALVLVESPASANVSGARLAAPLFRDIMREALLVRGILPKPVNNPKSI